MKKNELSMKKKGSKSKSSFNPKNKKMVNFAPVLPETIFTKIKRMFIKHIFIWPAVLTVFYTCVYYLLKIGNWGLVDTVLASACWAVAIPMSYFLSFLVAELICVTFKTRILYKNRPVIEALALLPASVIGFFTTQYSLDFISHGQWVIRGEAIIICIVVVYVVSSLFVAYHALRNTNVSWVK